MRESPPLSRYGALLARLFLACAALLAGAGLCGASDAEESKEQAEESKEQNERKDAAAAERDVDLIEQFRRHCVRVYIHGQSHEGAVPSVGDFGDDIRHERPTPIGGYWWDETHVVIPDPVLHDRFIRNIEITPPNSDKTYPARIAGRFILLQALLLEVLPDAEGNLPEAAPMRFDDGDVEEAIIATYLWDEGEWRLKVEPGLGTLAISDSGVETIEFAANGVVVGGEDGEPIGLAFGKSAVIDEELLYWFGRELPYTPILGTTERETFVAKLRERLHDAVLEARLRIRIKVDEDEEDKVDWTMELPDGQLRGGDAEVRAPALVVGKRHLLVPVGLPPAGIARIEGIGIVDRNGEELSAAFVGAFRDYMALMVETEKDLPVDNLPPGFSRLNPFAAPEKAGDGFHRPNMEFFHRWRIDYALGRRREVADYDRWVGTFRGYKGDAVVLTKTNEGDGSLAFDVDGNLAAIALTPRLIKSRDNYGSGRPDLEASPGFRPLDFIQSRLSAPDALDPSLQPVDEDKGQRLIDLGVEFQPLDRNSARLFLASRQTRGGNIGLLVTHVYPGSIAADLGLQEHDILLRIFIEGNREPMELRSSGFAFAGIFDIGDMTSESFQSFIRFMPPPWPSRENVLSTLLTAAGAGRTVTLEYLREGELERTEFATRYFEPDYRSAKKEKFPALGLTVKPITYEVARYFNRPDNSGVIVSRVEMGSKASVAGLHQYLLITQVNGANVAGVEDFHAKMRPFENGESASVELTVESFGKTRLVKIE